MSARPDSDDEDYEPEPGVRPRTRARGAAGSAAAPEAARAAGLPRLMREAGWILFLALGLYLVLILATYSKADPSWFHTATAANGDIANKGGTIGARIADLAFGLNGVSAWWWVTLMAYAVMRFFKRVETWSVFNRRHLAIVAVGFLLLLTCSSTLEAMRLHSLTVALPLEPGGVVGNLLAGAVQSAFGFTGGTLLLLALIAAAISVFSGLSWIRLSEKIGTGLEWVYVSLRNAMERKRDQSAGEAAAEKREEKVEEMKRAIEAHPPIRIEPTITEVPQSERVRKEKQAQLFSDLPDSPLPPIALLDPPDESIERPSNETLEFTSRLIERKLLDFNVQAKVVAAHPGPVITRYEIEPAVGVKGAQIVNLSRDLARALSVTSIRVVETIPGTSYMGLEIPNPKREIVRLSE
ncbi:MAG: DNA translocase FtsK 4TM domain-containing protein, partial [Betaproteobacteria bacterium]|nr:DNA translocase FtsK 4TM domain-containing protein [Betaproteobacteria bacterium]